MYQFLHPLIFKYQKRKTKMGSKALLFLGFFLAIFFMISSEVVARELAHTSNSMNSNNITTDALIKRIPRPRPGTGSIVCRFCDTCTTFICKRCNCH